MAVGSQAQVILTVALNEDVEVGVEIAAESRVESSMPDAIPSNNELLTQIAVLPQADFYVTSLGEGNDTNPGDGVCAANGGCTLRAAIQEANARPDPQTIALGYGVHQINIEEGSGRLVRQSGSGLFISDDVTLIGLSPDRTILHANGQERVLSMAGVNVTLRDLMLTGGVTGGSGGAILIGGGNLTLERVAVAGNQADGYGGGIQSEGGATVTIRQSAFTDNRAGQQGGAMRSDSGALRIENSTLSRNQADQGGAIFHAGGSVTLVNVTGVGNSAASEGGGIHATGDGVSLLNTILAENSAPLGANCLGRFTSGGHNLLGNLDSCTILGQTGSNIITEERAWGKLGRSFAETYAYDLFPGSPAINAGRCELPTDQRGVERAASGCDIGAIEYDPLAGISELVYLPSVSR
jgi:CSLREA domain-containing protein